MPCGSGGDVEQLGQRLAEVREGRARAEIDALPDGGSGDEQRHVFTEWSVLGVVGSLPWSAVTIEEIPWTRGAASARTDAHRTARDWPRIRRVVAVAVDGVEVDEVREDQPRRDDSCIARSIASIPSSSLAVWTARRDAAAGEEILDFPDRDDGRSMRRPAGRAASRRSGGSAKSLRFAVRDEAARRRRRTAGR